MNVGQTIQISFAIHFSRIWFFPVQLNEWESSIFSPIKPKLELGLFVDFCVFTCFYQFLHDVIIKLFCRSTNNPMSSLLIPIHESWITFLNFKELWLIWWERRNYCFQKLNHELKTTELASSCCMLQFSFFFTTIPIHL